MISPRPPEFHRWEAPLDDLRRSGVAARPGPPCPGRPSLHRLPVPPLHPIPELLGHALARHSSM